VAVAVVTEQRVDPTSSLGRPFGWQKSGDVNSRVNVGGIERWLSFMVGAAMIYRGVTGFCRVYQALGITHADGHARERGTGVIADRGSDTRSRLGGHRGIHVEEAVTINRPVSEVFRFWRNFENLPRFMRHLELVAMREEGVSRWVAKGPAGMKVEWDARIINEVHNEVIGWQSLEGSLVATAGSVHFDDADGGTLVRVNLQYSPPAGKLGSVVARFFGEEPGVQIREDLQRLKMLLERPAGE
jgi:uncharacterized membrane protein